MKKLIIISALSIGIGSISMQSIQAQAFAKDKFSVQVGHGFINVIQSLLVSDYGGEFGYNRRNLGPYHFRVEYGIDDHVGIGLSANYVRAQGTFSNVDVSDYNYDIGYENLSALLRLNVHIGSNEKVDPYVACGLGYRTGKWWALTDDPDFNFGGTQGAINPFGMEAVLGVKFLFTENFGAYTEMGMAKSAIQFGLVGSF